MKKHIITLILCACLLTSCAAPGDIVSSVREENIKEEATENKGSADTHVSPKGDATLYTPKPPVSSVSEEEPEKEPVTEKKPAREEENNAGLHQDYDPTIFHASGKNGPRPPVEVPVPTEPLAQGETPGTFQNLQADSREERGIVRSGNMSRLYNVMKRAEAGDFITIGFIGGSITEGAGSTDKVYCYVSRICAWWEQNFPNATFSFVNAGISGTDSIYGCARLDTDLLCYKPDVVFVEYSVNDSYGEEYLESYESLVRKCLIQDNNPAVVALHMCGYGSGKSVENTHANITAHYNIPAVSTRPSIEQDIQAGILKEEWISDDGTHPNDSGYAEVAHIIKYFLTKVYCKGFDKSCYVDYAVPEAMRTLTSINMVTYNRYNLNPYLKGFEEDTEWMNDITEIFRDGYIGDEVGDTMIFTVTASKVYFQIQAGVADSRGHVEVITDGVTEWPMRLGANDESTLMYFPLIYDGEYGEHTFEIKVTEKGELPYYVAAIITAEE